MTGSSAAFAASTSAAGVASRIPDLIEVQTSGARPQAEPAGVFRGEPMDRAAMMIEAVARQRPGSVSPHALWGAAVCRLAVALDPQLRIERLLAAIPHAQGPLDAAEAQNTLAHLGHVSEWSRGRAHAFDPRLLPILFRDSSDDRPVILVADDAGQVAVVDPLTGISRPVDRRGPRGEGLLMRRYDPRAEPTSHFMRKASGHGWLRAFLGRFRPIYLQAFLAGFVINLLSLMPPLFVMVLYDRVIGTSDLTPVALLAFGALLAVLFEWWLRQIRREGLAWFAGRLDNAVGNSIFTQLFGLSPVMLFRAPVFSQIARIKTLEGVREFFTGAAFLAMLDTPFVVLSLIVIALLAGPLVLLPIAAIALLIALQSLVRSRLQWIIKLAAFASSARHRFLIETFERVDTIRALGLAQGWGRRHTALSGRDAMAQWRIAWTGALAETAAHSVTTLTALATVSVGIAMVWSGLLSQGALVAVMLLVFRVLSPFHALCASAPRIEQLRNSVQQVDTLMDLETEAESQAASARLPRMRGQLSFRDVSVRLREGEREEFSHLTLDVKPGEVVAVTGREGTGASSILGLTSKLVDPAWGTVRVDGFDVRQLDGPSIRRQIAYLPAVPDLFAGSVADNLRLIAPRATDDNLAEALGKAAAERDVFALPQGVDTWVGRGGINISEDLAARLMLARFYLHGGQLALIDALPPSVLAGSAGKNLRAAIQAWRGGRTVMMCTQHRDFLELADTVVWLRPQRAPHVGPASAALADIEAEGGLV